MSPSTSHIDSTPAQRAHVRRTSILLLLYGLVLPPLVWWRAHHDTAPVLALAMAVVAALPVLGLFASWGRYISDERDEYQQSIALRRIAVATNVTMGAAVVWGFLQAFGVMPLIEAYWIPFVWVMVQGLFGCLEVIAARRQRN